MPPQDSVVLVDGPWSHRTVSAGGLSFHVAECGPADGPLVLLLHGFPEFWWSWRHQLVALARAGFRAVAPDLRGTGASDKPPRGYDAYTLAGDVAGLVRALGARDADVVGAGTGALVAWTVATLHPRSVRRLVAVSAAHPLRLWQGLREPQQARASAFVAGFQLPRVPEARLRGGRLVGDLLGRWGGPGFPDRETDARCREAMAVPGAAHSALEQFRWAVRSQARPEGRRFRRVLERGVQAPVLHLQGALDTCVLPRTAVGSQAWARGPYELRVLAGVGHFPHEEVPHTVSAAVLGHVGDREPGRHR